MGVCLHSRFAVPVILLVSITGCASDIPVEIRQEPVSNPSVTAVGRDTDRFVGQDVRWGGTIASVENKEDSTWIEIVSTPLNSYGRPYRPDDESQGRFLARFEGFLDPEIYGQDRRITVYGNIESRLVRKIDDYPYTYPLIRVTKHYLWSNRHYSPYRYYAYDPFYDPYWYHPYYRFNFRHHYLFRHHYGHFYH